MTAVFTYLLRETILRSNSPFFLFDSRPFRKKKNNTITDMYTLCTYHHIILLLVPSLESKLDHKIMACHCLR